MPCIIQYDVSEPAPPIEFFAPVRIVGPALAGTTAAPSDATVATAESAASIRILDRKTFSSYGCDSCKVDSAIAT
jgi:hypothetical protein